MMMQPIAPPHLPHFAFLTIVSAALLLKLSSSLEEEAGVLDSEQQTTI